MGSWPGSGCSQWTGPEISISSAPSPQRSVLAIGLPHELGALAVAEEGGIRECLRFAVLLAGYRRYCEPSRVSVLERRLSERRLSALGASLGYDTGFFRLRIPLSCSRLAAQFCFMRQWVGSSVSTKFSVSALLLARADEGASRLGTSVDSRYQATQPCGVCWSLAPHALSYGRVIHRTCLFSATPHMPAVGWLVPTGGGQGWRRRARIPLTIARSVCSS